MAVPLPPEYGAAVPLPAPPLPPSSPVSSRMCGRPPSAAAATSTGSSNRTRISTESPARSTAVAFDAVTLATDGALVSSAAGDRTDSDPGPPGGGSPSRAGLPAASAIEAPLADRASAPLYDRAPVRSPGLTAYENESVSVLLPPLYRAIPGPSPPVSRASAGTPSPSSTSSSMPFMPE